MAIRAPDGANKEDFETKTEMNTDPGILLNIDINIDIENRISTSKLVNQYWNRYRYRH